MSFCKLGFCSFFCSSGAFLLLTDLVDNDSQGSNGCKESAENLSNEAVLGRKLTEALQLINTQDGTFNEAALDGQNLLVLFGKFADDASRCNGVAGGAGERSGAVEQLIKLVIAGLVGGETGESVLDNAVIYAGFTELIAKLSILCDGDALVVNKDCGGSALQLVSQCINNCLFAFEYLIIGQFVSPPKKMSSCRKT